MWSRYLAEAIELLAGQADVAFASHHWPTWGTDAIVAYLTEQRDLIGLPARPDAAAAQQGLCGQRDRRAGRAAPGLDRAWHTHGYYGSASHNLKAIYQRYRMDLSNGARIHHPTNATAHAEVSIALTRSQLVRLLAGKTGGVAIDGDASVLTRLTGLLDEPDPTFAVVTP